MTQTTEDVGWILTYTGRQFWPLRPRAADVNHEDIAWALANQCRYSGHTSKFYSVAQHCWIASKIEWEGLPPKGSRDRVYAKLILLLHDAPEAYLVDLPRPIKHAPGMDLYRAAEEAVWQAILDHFHLPAPPVWLDQLVKLVDLVLLATERRDLLPKSPIPWRSTENVAPLAKPIVPSNHTDAAWHYRNRLCELLLRYHFPDANPARTTSASGASHGPGVVPKPEPVSPGTNP